MKKIYNTDPNKPIQEEFDGRKFITSTHPQKEDELEKKFFEDLADNEWIVDDPYSPDKVVMPLRELEKRTHSLLSQSKHDVIQEVEEKCLEAGYGDGEAIFDVLKELKGERV